MTIIEVLLSLAIVIVAAQVFILQRHYNEKLSEQAAVLNYLINEVMDKSLNIRRLKKIKSKLFDSSQ